MYTEREVAAMIGISAMSLGGNLYHPAVGTPTVVFKKNKRSRSAAKRAKKARKHNR
jgi:hypothetical protein